jgi:hypothetical protein
MGAERRLHAGGTERSGDRCGQGQDPRVTHSRSLGGDSRPVMRAKYSSVESAYLGLNAEPIRLRSSECRNAREAAVTCRRRQG